MTELDVYWFIIWGWVGVAVLSFLALFWITAPYGRHARGGWGPMIPSTLGWVLMEAPALLGVWVLFAIGSRLDSPVAWVFVGLWTLHYFNRSFIFPLRRRGGDKPMPLTIASSAVFFNLVNGYLQGRWLFELGPERGLDWLVDPRFIVGVAIFLAGWWINLQSDAILRNLRRPGETGYKIPRGGLYRWISSPNYFGEIVEWCGWALLTWSPCGLVFAAWTAANLGPRALANHRWYHDKFADYPPERRALVPFVF